MHRELSIHNVTWHYIEKTSAKDIQYLAEHFKFHPLDLQDCYDVSQRPKIDTYPSYLFLVFHFPYYDQKYRRIRAHELNVFVGKGYVITLSHEPIPLLAEYFQEVQEKSAKKPKHDKLKNTSGYMLYKILDLLFGNTARLLDTMSQLIIDVEEEVYSDNTKHAAKDLGIIRRNIMNLRRHTQPQVRMLGQLVALRTTFMPHTLSVYFDDVHDNLERMWSSIETYRENIDGLHNTNESLINQKTSEVVKLLTLISVGFLPLTLLSGIYGMNIEGLPFANHPGAFMLFFGVALIFIGGLIHFSRRKDLI
ncbi:MAG: magnesium transporter CorA family protein [Patescibacteria group bacterium]|jgi:magnesium transporter